MGKADTVHGAPKRLSVVPRFAIWDVPTLNIVARVAVMTFCWLLGITILACAPAPSPATATLALPTQTLVSSATPPFPTVTIPAPTATPTAVPSATATRTASSITRINIDGDATDWTGRELLQNTWSGHAEPGFLDFTTGYTFVNRHALYLLVKTADSKAAFVQFDMLFQADTKRLLISWSPEQPQGSIGDVTNDFKFIGPTTRSTFAFGPALEARIDLRDLGLPQNIRLLGINVMVGKCCDSPAWRVADQWQPASTPVVNEIDAPRIVSDEPQYALARRFQLPEGYVAQRLFAPPVPDLGQIVRSQKSVIYLKQTRQNSGLTTLDPISGKTQRILDLPEETSYLVGGPEDTALIGVGSEIWQVCPDGSHTVWGQVHNAGPIYYTTDGRLVGVSPDWTRLLHMLPDGSSREIASGFSKIEKVVAAPDGTIFVSDWETGDITRVNPDGSKRVLVKHILYRDPILLEVDPAGQLFFNSVVTNLVKVDPSTGAMTPYDWAVSPCAPHQMDFVFATPDRILFIDPMQSQVSYADLSSHKTGLLVSNQGANTWAVATGPDNALYVGAWGCGDEIPAQVIRIDDHGARSVYVDGLRDEVRDVAFAPDGGLYVATFNRKQGTLLFLIPPNGGTPVQIPITPGLSITSIAVDSATGNLLASESQGSAILEITRAGSLSRHPIQLPKAVFDLLIDIAPDGTLYAYCSEAERQKTGPIVSLWVLKVDWKNGVTTIVTQIDYSGCCVMGNLSADSHGEIWWLYDPKLSVYRIMPDGNRTLFAQNLPVDPAGIAVDRQGEVYFTSSSGIFRIYREQ